MKKEIYVRITGGLGNQLFGLAASIEQAMRLNCRAVLLRGQYGEENPREFLLDQLSLPDFVEIDDGELEIQAARNLPVFRESGFGFDQSIMDIERGAILEGYFQSPKYFENSRLMVDEIIFDEGIQSPERSPGFELLEDTFLAVHVRRGDYLKAETLAFHGATGLRYFQSAQALMRLLHGHGSSIVFTDSPAHVEIEFAQSKQDWKLFDPSGGLRDLDTLRVMSSADAIIMSNSSFSWWAAWKIHSRRNSQGAPKVIAPRPWFTNGESASDLLDPSWITLGS